MHTLAFRVRYFSRTNPPKLYSSNMDEDAQEFMNEIYKVISIIGVSSKEKVELETYQLKKGFSSVVHSMDG